MKPTIRIAQRACEAAGARQAVVASYAETKAECSAVKPVCNAIADAIDAGDLPCPGDVRADNLSDKRRGEVAGWREYNELRNCARAPRRPRSSGRLSPR